MTDAGWVEPCLEEPDPVVTLATSFLVLFALGGGVEAGSAADLFWPLPAREGDPPDPFSASKLMGLGGGSISAEGRVASEGPFSAAEGVASIAPIGGVSVLSAAGGVDIDGTVTGFSSCLSGASCLSVRFSRSVAWDTTVPLPLVPTPTPPPGQNPNGRGGPGMALDSVLSLMGVMRLRPSVVRDSTCLPMIADTDNSVTMETLAKVGVTPSPPLEVGAAPSEARAALSCRAKSSGSSISSWPVWPMAEEEEEEDLLVP